MGRTHDSHWQLLPREQKWWVPSLCWDSRSAQRPKLRVAGFRTSARWAVYACGSGRARDGGQWLCRFLVFSQQTRAGWTTVYTTPTLARGLTAIVAQDPAIPRTDSTVRSASVTAIQPNSRGCGQGRSQGRSWPAHARGPYHVTVSSGPMG